MDSDVLHPRAGLGAAGRRPRGRRPRSGGAPPSSTRSTCAASRTANGDGTGDLAGVRAPAPYLRGPRRRRDLVHPLVPVAAGRRRLRRRATTATIDPQFGTLGEAEALIAEALALGIRTIIDIVPNHISDQHAWFQAALAAGPGSPERERFWFHPGNGEHGDRMPNDWVSQLRRAAPGPARRTPTARPASGTCTCSRPSSPTSTGTTPTCAREHEDILRFWFDRGVGGVRIDSAALLIKDPALPEVPENPGPGEHPTPTATSCTTSTAAGARSPTPTPAPACSSARSGCPDTDRFAQYLRPDEMHTAFNFDFLARPWDAGSAARVDRHDARRARARRRAGTWVLSNHDVTRPVTRYGREDTSFAFDAKRFGTPTDLDARHAPGPRRRAADRRAARLASTSIRATSSACPRSRTCRSTLLAGPHALPLRRRRPGPRRLPGAAAVAGDGRALRVQPATAPTPSRGSRSPPAWAGLTVEAQEADPASMLPLPRGPRRAPARAADLGDGAPRLARLRRTTSLAFRRGDAVVVRRQPRRQPPSRCPQHIRACSLASADARGRPTAHRLPPSGCGTAARSPQDASTRATAHQKENDDEVTYRKIAIALAQHVARRGRSLTACSRTMARAPARTPRRQESTITRRQVSCPAPTTPRRRARRCR